METFPWGFVIVGGPIILGLAIAWGYFRSASRDAKMDPHTPADDPSKGMPGHDRAPSALGSSTGGRREEAADRPQAPADGAQTDGQASMSARSKRSLPDIREQRAEDALPEGVARGRSLNTTADELRLRAGGVGPGDQVGPDPNTQRLQEGRALSREPEGDLPQGPLSGDPRTPVPTTAKNQEVDDLDQT